MRRADSSQVRTRNAFTLFEVLITLGLSVVLMGMIGFAIGFYAEQLNVRDSEARRIQLARSILRMIAEDLQACVYPAEFDAAALAEVLASSATGASAGSVPSTSSSSDSDSVTIDTTDDALDDTAIADSMASTERPGLIGNQFQIQFDVSRLPRMEEYMPIMANPADVGIEDLPSDVKTVAYYVQQAGLAGVGDNIERIAEGASANFETTGGLVRRALSRELTSYASQSGDINRLNQTGDLIAPEVVQIEFAYFDGTQWIFEWNSDESNALPIAVQIRLTLSDPNANSNDGVDIGMAESDQPTQGDVYDLMVRLPMAKLVAGDDTEDEDLSAAGI